LAETSQVEKVNSEKDIVEQDILEESLEKGYTLATPSVRRIAKENNVNLKEIEGSGPKGRILKGDILAYIEKLKSAVSEVDPKSISNEGVPLNGIQKAMYKSMTKSLSIPHFGYSEEIVLDALVNLRKDVNSSLGSIKLSYMPFFIKALSLSLVKYPILNTALLDDSSHSTAKLLYRKEHHVGVAMDTPGG